MSEPVEIQVIDSVPPSGVTGLAKFVEVHYLTPNTAMLEGGAYSQGGDDTERYLTWTIDKTKSGQSRYPLAASNLPVKLTISAKGVVVGFPGVDPSDHALGEVCQRVADDIEVISTSFLDHAKRTSLHYVFPLGALPKKAADTGGLRREVVKRIFAGNTVNLFLLLIAVSFIFILFLGDYAIIAILVAQGLMLLFADRIVQGAGVVNVTKDQQNVALVRVASTPEVLKSMSKAGRGATERIMEHVEVAAAKNNLTDPSTKDAIYQALRDSGVPCSPSDVQVTERNPYSLVARVAGKFNLPVPRVVVVNTPMDNASATGASHSHAAMTITAGALEDLNDDELESVIGHEFGHIRGRDPIILFCVTTFMYLGGLFLWLPVLLYLGLFYFIIAFAIIYMVGKFLETRADTESVMVLGQPRILASALTRIGFTQLYYERYSPQARFFDWLRFDPHPPIYFRVTRLSRMAERGTEIHHALADSVRDVISGFFGSIVGA